MPNYVDRDVLKSNIMYNYHVKNEPYELALYHAFEETPTINTEHTIYAHWVMQNKHEPYEREYTCSRCGNRVKVMSEDIVEEIYPYCVCGAKMDEKEWMAEYDEFRSVCGAHIGEEK